MSDGVARNVAPAWFRDYLTSGDYVQNSLQTEHMVTAHSHSSPLQKEKQSPTFSHLRSFRCEPDQPNKICSHRSVSCATQGAVLWRTSWRQQTMRVHWRGWRSNVNKMWRAGNMQKRPSLWIWARHGCWAFAPIPEKKDATNGTSWKITLTAGNSWKTFSARKAQLATLENNGLVIFIMNRKPKNK